MQDKPKKSKFFDIPNAGFSVIRIKDRNKR